MLHREFDPGVIYAAFTHRRYRDFRVWEDKAAAGTRVLTEWVAAHPVKQKGESLPVDSEIYGALKDCLKAYFHNKCAYCESEFDTVAWGDVEHYRPKRGVKGETHPGYYWLAYSAGNLMPSCQHCNQGQGKGNHFPIAGTRALKPGDDLAAELPLLLNPYQSGGSPGHIRYIIEESGWEVLPTGLVEGITDRGRVSVKLYDLQRPSLAGRRRKNQRAAINALNLAAGTPKLKQVWDGLFDPSEEHASAVRAACLKWREVYLRQLREATNSGFL
jgi:hypothetical protein